MHNSKIMFYNRLTLQFQSTLYGEMRPLIATPVRTLTKSKVNLLVYNEPRTIKVTDRFAPKNDC